MNSNRTRRLRQLLSVLAIAAAVKAAGVGFAPSGWAAEVTYSIDDGSAERALGIDPGEDVIWFNTFPVQSGGEVIDLISASYGRPGLSGALNGFPITILLYEDTDGGDPFNTVLKTSLTTTIANANSNTLNVYNLHAYGSSRHVAAGSAFPEHVDGQQVHHAVG